jgi:hypothetical protein
VTHEEARPTRGDEKLRALARWAGAGLLLSCLFPHGVFEGRPMWLWQLAPELAPAHLAAALATPLVGLWVLACSRASRSARGLATSLAAGLVALPLVTWSSAPWDDDGATFGFLHRSAPFALSAALTVAALCPAASALTAGRRRALVVAAIVIATLGYAWPFADEPALATLVRSVRLVLARPSVGAASGVLWVGTLSLLPLLAPLFALGEVRSPPPRAPVPLIASLSLPTLMAPWALRALGEQHGGSGEVYAGLGEALSLVALGSLLSLSLCVLVGRPSLPLPLGDLPTPLASVAPLAMTRVRHGVRALALLAPAAIALLVPAALASLAPASPPLTPAPPATAPAAPSPAAERLFAEVLPAWNDARRRVDLDGAPASLGRPDEVVDAASALGSDMGRAVGDLAAAAGSPGLTLRRWGRLTSGVNAAARAAGLPYRVDPTQGVASPDRSKIWFRLDTFRIERASQVPTWSGPVEALHLRALTPRRGVLSVLGLSRDGEPAALVLLDVVADQASELERLGRRPSPRCAGLHGDEPPAVAEAHARCGAILARLAADGPLEALLLSAVERHEAEHQLDGPRLPIAPLVARRMPLHEPSTVAEVNRELSAYLAELTASGAAPSLSLARLFRFASSRRHATERQVARLALEALSGLDASSPTAAAAAFTALAPLDPGALRLRADAAWRAQFPRPRAHRQATIP